MTILKFKDLDEVVIAPTRACRTCGGRLDQGHTKACIADRVRGNGVVNATTCSTRERRSEAQASGIGRELGEYGLAITPR